MSDGAERDQAAAPDGAGAPSSFADLIVDGISDILMLLDAETHRIEAVNRAFVETYKLSREQAHGMTCHQATHHRDAPCDEGCDPCPCPIQQCVASGEPSRVEHVHLDSGGEEVHVEIIVYPMRDAGGAVTKVVHLSRDVTHRHKLETERREQEKLRGICALAGAASHELNQPLTVMLIGLRELERRHLGSPEDAHLVEMVLADAERLLEISRKLARVTRYATRPYVGHEVILDLDRASEEPAEGER